MAYSISCDCGKFKGLLQQNAEINRCTCYCNDCQAFARFLNPERDILDRAGGTDIIQTIPANIQILEGMEYLACLRLTNNGMLRWYARCCHTPIGNTPPTLNPSFIGLIHNCLSVDRLSLDRSFGQIQMRVNVNSAIGDNKPKSIGFLSGTLRILSMLIKARLDGRFKQTPFFDISSGNPIVVPEVLDNEGLKALKHTE